MRPYQIVEAGELLRVQRETDKILERWGQVKRFELLEVQIVGVFEGTKPHSVSSGCYTHTLGRLPDRYLNDIVDSIASLTAARLKELGVDV